LLTDVTHEGVTFPSSYQLYCGDGKIRQVHGHRAAGSEGVATYLVDFESEFSFPKSEAADRIFCRICEEEIYDNLPEVVLYAFTVVESLDDG
jgi:hypothetical protein